VTEVADMEDPTDEDVTRSDAALARFEELQSERAESQAYEDRLEAMRSAEVSGSTESGDQSGQGEVRRSRGRGPEVKTNVDPYEILRSNNAHMDKAEYTEALRSAHLDPTLILTNQGAKDVVRTMSRQVTLTGGANKWNGVTTAGATASWDAELTEVSDDTPPVAPVSVPVFSAKALIQASIESFEDINGLTSDVQMLLADARTRLEATAHMTGSGSGQPTGIFPALSGNGAVTVSLTTGHTWTLADIQAVALSLGDRWTEGSEWLMHPKFLGEIQALGTALGATYSTDLTQPFTQQILGHKVNQSFIAPSVSQTTTIDNLAVFGDFSNFLIVDKPGSTSIEFIPHLFNTSNNLPDGRRAWYMHFRNGSDSVNDLAFRLLVDKTTA
jgi:HK97 family phage major capsid protein